MLSFHLNKWFGVFPQTTNAGFSLGGQSEACFVLQLLHIETFIKKERNKERIWRTGWPTIIVQLALEMLDFSVCRKEKACWLQHPAKDGCFWFAMQGDPPGHTAFIFQPHPDSSYFVSWRPHKFFSSSCVCLCVCVCVCVCVFMSDAQDIFYS